MSICYDIGRYFDRLCLPEADDDTLEGSEHIAKVTKVHSACQYTCVFNIYDQAVRYNCVSNVHQCDTIEATEYFEKILEKTDNVIRIYIHDFDIFGRLLVTTYAEGLEKSVDDMIRRGYSYNAKNDMYYTSPMPIAESLNTIQME